MFKIFYTYRDFHPDSHWFLHLERGGFISSHIEIGSAGEGDLPDRLDIITRSYRPTQSLCYIYICCDVSQLSLLVSETGGDNKKLNIHSSPNAIQSEGSATNHGHKQVQQYQYKFIFCFISG